MSTHYHHHCIGVNHHHCFTPNNYGCTLSPMTLAERLLQARTFAKLRQDELAKQSGVSQQAISRLETGVQKSSTDIVQLAVACGVRPEWLAMEQGEMVKVTEYDRWTERVIHDMQCMKEEEKRYLVITAEALVKDKQRPYDGPQRREKNDNPNPERRWGEIYYEGATDYEYDSTDRIERKRREEQ
ncbi:helix-turn-helix protein [Nitrosospira sp. Nsp2]|uniref:helix-turn-helix domain-containing protein n=1 Tax=Nitrosospira sp. Nsp2 TaxID=136548 RepID=UPI000D3108E3|nr:helix-turn-helix transcriptional regulator [Nitrosospira sp. Nsp2]PTR17478.1 helix-turn-helix protein [Nitrosospira sp. Nsp2]